MAEISVADFGGNIQGALDAGAAVVRIPAGAYRTHGLRLGSHTRLVAEAGARIVFADGAGRDESCFLLTNRDHEAGNAGIAIEGGVWDGNSAGNPRGPDRPGSFTGAAFNFSRVRGLTVRDVSLHDATAYYLRLCEVSRFTLEAIRFTAGQWRPNQDGIHIAGFCEDGVIRDICATGVGVTHDDLVALVADDALHRAQNLGLKCGPVRRMTVERLRADDCHSFVRLASVWHPIEDVRVHDVQGGCRICALNCDALRYCMVPVFDPRDPRYAGGVGFLGNVSIDAMTVFKTADTGLPLFLLETRMQDFTVRKVRRDRARDLAPRALTLRVRGVETPGLVLDGPPVELKRDGEFVFNGDAFGEFAVKDCLLQDLPAPVTA